MRQKLACAHSDQLALGRRDGAAAMDHDAFAPDPSRVEPDGSNKVRFDLGRGVSLAHLERRVTGAAHRRIEQGLRNPGVPHAGGVVEVLGGFALEHRLALLDVHSCEAHRLGDRRRRQPSLEHFFEDFEAGAAGRGLEQEERVLPADRARALHPRLHHKPEKADITAKIPSAAMATPLKTLIPRTTAGVSRALSREAASTRMHHQAAEPSSTPATTSPGPAKEPPVPKPSAAASAANEMIVAGLVIVSPSVETSAQASPRPVGFAAASPSRRRSNRMRRPNPTRTAPPTTASGRRPLTNAAVRAARPKVAMAA